MNITPIDQKKRSRILGEKLMSRVFDEGLDHPLCIPRADGSPGCFYTVMLSMIFILMVFGFGMLAWIKI